MKFIPTRTHDADLIGHIPDSGEPWPTLVLAAICPHGIDLNNTCELCYHANATDPE